MQTVETIRLERERRERVARERAASLPPGDYFASGISLMEHRKGERPRFTLQCESHIDACLVLMATRKK